MTFGMEKLEWRRWKKSEDMITRFKRIHERDRQTQTDTQTPHDVIGHAYA